MKKLLIPIIVLALVGLAVALALNIKGSGPREGYKFVEIKRGDLEKTISATGTLSALHTVEVGTQVSGTIAHIYVDYNDRVEKGQLLAVLDTSLLEANLLEAEANYQRAKAQLEKAQDDYRRSLALYKKGIITESEFIAAKTDFKIQEASLKSAEAALKKARRNLKYAYIRSPIDGIVIERNVEEGQTVAASFATPTLFIIAEDLSKMQILAMVDESDIGEIKEGQKVRFTVEAYPEKTFSGVVRQIRLQPTTIQNVVNYTVVIDAPNPEGLLLPGMTATVDFIVEQRKNVLLVPNSALRFKPTAEMLEEFRKNLKRRLSKLPEEKRKEILKRRSGFLAGKPSLSSSRKIAKLWFLDREGRLMMSVVRLGASDGHMTEIIGGRGIHEGMKVISGLGREEKAERKTSPPPRRRRFIFF